MSDAPSRNLHGPRPPPLSLSKQSHKIRKQKAAQPPPATAKAKAHHHHHSPPPPVIIYTVSPKKIHVDPDQFMSVVQRLTGSSSSTLTNTSPPPPPPPSGNGGGVFPAAHPASVGNAELPEWRETQLFDGGVEMSQNLLWNATDHDSNHLNTTGLRGNRNLNNLVENNLTMNMPSSSNFDVFNYLYDI